MITIISIMVVVFPKERRNYGIFYDTLKEVHVEHGNREEK